MRTRQHQRLHLEYRTGRVVLVHFPAGHGIRYSGTEIQCRSLDDSGGGQDGRAMPRQYRYRMRGFCGFRIAESHPINDDCPGTDIPSLPFTESGNTTMASQITPLCATSNHYNDVVYRYISPGCEQIWISFCGTGFNTDWEVHSRSCTNPALIACSNEGCPDPVGYLADDPDTLYIICGGQTPADFGPYTINVTSEPMLISNDTCPGRSISSVPYSYNGRTDCAFNDQGTCAGPQSNPGNLLRERGPTNCTSLRLPMSKSFRLTSC